MSKTVMITGGTGYIGAWVVKMFLEKGYTMRLMVRDKSKTAKYQNLVTIAAQSPGKLEIWEGDLLKAGSYDAAAAGADLIIHMASPFTLRFKDAQKELIDPALLGTRNVLNAATKSGTVKKVVLTSSVAAVHGDAIDMQEQGLKAFTEAQFNTTSSLTHQPYSYSKVLAEKEAWKMAGEQNQWKLVVINPSFVMGPALTHSSDSESIEFMKGMLNGKYRSGVPEIYYGYVDVRDVARAHLLAAENDSAEGRHILAERTMSMVELSDFLKKKYGSKYKTPLMKTPKLMALMVGWMFGLTPKYVKRNVGYPIRLNSSKSKEKLGLQYTNIETTIEEMVAQLAEQKMI